MNVMRSDFSERSSSSKAVPAIVQLLLIGLPAVTALGSITPPQLENWLPVTSLFEFYFFSAALIIFLKFSSRISRSFLLLLLFTAVHTFLAFVGLDSPADEIYRAHKWLFYLLALSIFVGYQMAAVNKVVSLTKFLILAAVTKYALVFFALGPTSRPGIFAENNYELFLFMGLLVVCYRFMGRRAVLFLGLLGVAVMLSGSRSAATGFVALVAYVAFTRQSKHAYSRYIWVTLTAIVTIIPFLVFERRGSSIETLDRVVFLNRFLAETSNWNFATWALGAPPLTQLSSPTCQSLAYYSLLLSSNQDGSCYSVILHAFVLRVLFDFGVLGLLVSVLGLWHLMKIGNVTVGVRLALIVLACLNGLSVSGPNNIYVILPIAFAILVRREQSNQAQLPRECFEHRGKVM
jgi:hypothetical protein